MLTLRVKSPCSTQPEGLGSNELVEDSAVKPNVDVTPTKLPFIERDSDVATVDVVKLRTGRSRVPDKLLDGVTKAVDIEFEELKEGDGSTAEVVVSTVAKILSVGSLVDRRRVKFKLEVEGKDVEPPALFTVGYSKEATWLVG